MMPSRSDEPSQTTNIGSTAPSGEGRPSTESADCRTCDLRSRCISWGWMSPGGVWFENAVMLKPKPGCRGFVGRGDDIRAHFKRRGPADVGH